MKGKKEYIFGCIQKFVQNFAKFTKIIPVIDMSYTLH